MKQINIAQMNRSQKEEALNEAKILQALKSPYIVGYHDSFIENEKLCIVMEYCENGDLAQLLKARHGRLLEEDTIWKYFIEISLALLYLHNKKILHRDIKTMNVFLTKDFHVRLGDLGVAKVLSQNTNFAHTMVGTPYYLSPELCQEKPYNEKSDVWSLGCVLYEMCALKHPFESRNQAALIMKIIQGKYDTLSNVYSKELVEIVTQCLQKDYRKRPTVHDVLSLVPVQLKAKVLRIEVPDKATLGSKSEPKKLAAPAEIVRKPAAAVVTVPIKPPTKPVPQPVKAEPAPPPKEKKEHNNNKKPEKKAPKDEKKKEHASTPDLMSGEKKHHEKKPSAVVAQTPPIANLNNNEFRKLLKDRSSPKIADSPHVAPPAAVPSSERKDKEAAKKAPVKPAVITAPNFAMIKASPAGPAIPEPLPTPLKEVVQKVLPSPALLQSRGKPKRVRNGAPAGLARKAHQVVQPAPIPILKKVVPSKNKTDPRDNDDSEIKAVANLPDFVGAPAKGDAKQEEEPYQFKKPTIEELLSQNAPTGTKKSDVKDPDSFMREVMGEDFSLVIKKEPAPGAAAVSPPTTDTKTEDIGLESVVKGIMGSAVEPVQSQPEVTAEVVAVPDTEILDKPLLVSVGYLIGPTKIEEIPSGSAEGEAAAPVAENGEEEPVAAENTLSSKGSHENDESRKSDSLDEASNNENESPETTTAAEAAEEIKEIEAQEPETESPLANEWAAEEEEKQAAKRQAEYIEKLEEFEKHKAQLAARIPLEDIEKCCELVKDNREMVRYFFLNGVNIKSNRLQKKQICCRNWWMDNRI